MNIFIPNDIYYEIVKWLVYEPITFSNFSKCSKITFDVSKPYFQKVKKIYCQLYIYGNILFNNDLHFYKIAEHDTINHKLIIKPIGRELISSKEIHKIDKRMIRYSYIPLPKKIGDTTITIHERDLIFNPVLKKRLYYRYEGDGEEPVDIFKNLFD